MNWMKLDEYDYKALRYAEIHGIIEYEVKGNEMTYVERFPLEGDYHATLNLDTMEETRRRHDPLTDIQREAERLGWNLHKHDKIAGSLYLHIVLVSRPHAPFANEGKMFSTHMWNDSTKEFYGGEYDLTAKESHTSFRTRYNRARGL